MFKYSSEESPKALGSWHHTQFYLQSLNVPNKLECLLQATALTTLILNVEGSAVSVNVLELHLQHFILFEIYVLNRLECLLPATTIITLMLNV